MATGFLLVFSTFPDAAQARDVSSTLVTEKLIACANMLPPIESIYNWKGERAESREVLVIMKTTQEAYAALETRLKALHPYEVPEIVAIPLAAGLPDYLQWISQNVSPADGGPDVRS